MFRKRSRICSDDCAMLDANLLAHEVAARFRKRAARTCLGDGSQSADGERRAEDAEIVVVHLVAQSGVTDLIEAL